MPSAPRSRLRSRSARPWITPVDRKLLEALASAPSVAGACRQAGLTRDRGVYRLRRLSEGFGSAVVQSRRGGPGVGGARLTRFGRSLLERSRGGEPGAPHRNRLSGTYHAGPAPRVDVEGGPSLVVAFRAREGEHVTVGCAPEALLLARARFDSSARNVLPAVVAGSRSVGREREEVTLLLGRAELRASVTPAAVERLKLARGRRLFVYLKATALWREGRAQS
jgi:molybdopterin-binding protein/molybdate transport repressor ModE-like protein